MKEKEREGEEEGIKEEEGERSTKSPSWPG